MVSAVFRVALFWFNSYGRDWRDLGELTGFGNPKWSEVVKYGEVFLMPQKS